MIFIIVDGVATLRPRGTLAESAIFGCLTASALRRATELIRVNVRYGGASGGGQDDAPSEHVPCNMQSKISASLDGFTRFLSLERGHCQPKVS